MAQKMTHTPTPTHDHTNTHTQTHTREDARVGPTPCSQLLFSHCLGFAFEGSRGCGFVGGLECLGRSDQIGFVANNTSGLVLFLEVLT